MEVKKALFIAGKILNLTVEKPYIVGTDEF